MNTNGHREKNTSGGRRSFGWVVNYLCVFFIHDSTKKKRTKRHRFLGVARFLTSGVNNEG